MNLYESICFFHPFPQVSKLNFRLFPVHRIKMPFWAAQRQACLSHNQKSQQMLHKEEPSTSWRSRFESYRTTEALFLLICLSYFDSLFPNKMRASTETSSTMYHSYCSSSTRILMDLDNKQSGYNFFPSVAVIMEDISTAHQLLELKSTRSLLLVKSAPQCKMDKRGGG